MRLALALAVTGCFYPRSPTTVPKTPQPIDGLNTPYDDYNAAKPHHWRKLIYSTNRGSEGKDLDVWTVEVAWNATPAALTTPAPYAPALMSADDERGPIVMTGVADPDWRDVLVFASGRNGGPGGLDLYRAVLDDDPAAELLAHLSSPGNDTYLTPLDSQRRALFASDRDSGNYDLYEVQWHGGDLAAAPRSLARVAALSSDADDTAPYLDPDSGLLVFASTRAGGAGGFDLYCARRTRDGWSEPQPLRGVNSPRDEFRPSILEAGERRFLVFSSNRPGGAGGFDLYTVGLDGRCPAPAT